MLKAYLHRKIARMERAYGYDARYLHEMLDASTSAVLKFALFQPMAAHRDGVPLNAWIAAKLAATMSEDCGPCSQLVIDMGIEGGVPSGVLAALVRGDVNAAGADAAFGFRSGHAVAGNLPEAGALAAEALAKYGARGQASLAMAVASGRVYPALKRGLGHGQACQRLRVGDEAFAVKEAA